MATKRRSKPSGPVVLRAVLNVEESDTESPHGVRLGAGMDAENRHFEMFGAVTGGATLYLVRQGKPTRIVRLHALAMAMINATGSDTP